LGYNFGVGRQAPEFTLASHDGNDVKLKQYRGDWLPVLVFYADGLEGAADSVAALTRAGSDLWGYRAQVVGIVHPDVDGAKALADASESVGFPLVADVDGAVARAYSAWNTTAGASRDYVAIVDRSGKIVWTGEGDKGPLKPNEIIAALRNVTR
jgi:thioredoxin-dependent peroxiredoxin